MAVTRRSAIVSSWAMFGRSGYPVTADDLKIFESLVEILFIRFVNSSRSLLVIGTTAASPSSFARTSALVIVPEFFFHRLNTVTIHQNKCLQREFNRMP